MTALPWPIRVFCEYRHDITCTSMTYSHTPHYISQWHVLHDTFKYSVNAAMTLLVRQWHIHTCLMMYSNDSFTMTHPRILWIPPWHYLFFNDISTWHIFHYILSWHYLNEHDIPPWHYRNYKLTWHYYHVNDISSWQYVTMTYPMTYPISPWHINRLMTYHHDIYPQWHIPWHI